VRHGDDVHIVRADAIDDDKGESSNCQLPRRRTTAYAALRELRDRVEDLRNRVEEPGSATRSTFLVPANGFGKFE
jgi:hypothetical protein